MDSSVGEAGENGVIPTLVGIRGWAGSVVQGGVSPHPGCATRAAVAMQSPPWHQPSFRAISEITSKCGGRFSRVTTSQTRTLSPAFSAYRRSSRGVKPRLTCP